MYQDASRFQLVKKADDVATAGDQCLITTAGHVRCWRSYSSDPILAGYAVLPAVTDAVEVQSIHDASVGCVRRKTGAVTYVFSFL